MSTDCPKCEWPKNIGSVGPVPDSGSIIFRARCDNCGREWDATMILYPASESEPRERS